MFALPLDRPALMGILNVTPDSFSDGGLHLDASAAIDAGLRMMEEGADLIDVGGESTRPGAEAVDAREELRRVLPVVEALASKGVPVSIDTGKAEVAEKALAAGAMVVNDVTAFSDADMAEVCARAGCTVCLMHMKGDPRTMQQNPRYTDVVAEVASYLRERAESAEEAGVNRSNIWIDPGIGFGKTAEHNVALVKNLDQLAALDYPVLVGVSRKSFIGRILGSAEQPLLPEQRLEGTLAAQVVAQLKGAKVIRAHDVLSSRRTIAMVAALS
jgi:dihydropteroate synthase